MNYLPIMEELLFVNTPVEVKPETLRTILESVVYFIGWGGQLVENDVDIEGTIRHHSGDSRLWWIGSGYDNWNDYIGVIVKDSDYIRDAYSKNGAITSMIDYIEQIDIDLYNDIQTKLKK